MARKKLIQFAPLLVLAAFALFYGLRYAWNFMHLAELSITETVERLYICTPAEQKFYVTDPDEVARLVSLVNTTAFRKDLRAHNDSPSHPYGMLRFLGEEGSVCDIEFTQGYDGKIRFCVYNDGEAFVAYHANGISSQIADFLAVECQ